MGKVTGFLEVDRELPQNIPVEERIKNNNEFHNKPSEEELKKQGSRCMDCGVPTCHWGCPLGNIIPDWNDRIYRGRWKEALDRLHKTNNFPEFTGRLCPAPCEASCVLSINKDAVTIKEIELNIIEHGFKEGWVVAKPPLQETGKSVAVVGSGPSGMAAAQQLRRLGHKVTLFEKSANIGGLLRYGIPDFKLEKHIIERRVAQMVEEGVEIKTGVNVGVDITADQLKANFDAVCLTGGAMKARDLPIEGRDLVGIYQAMEFLVPNNKKVAGEELADGEFISAHGKRVLVIGGGDTGADCVGVSNRHGAKSVMQIEIMPKPPLERTDKMPWPNWPFILRTSTSHEEGVERDWSIMSKRFVGSDGKLEKVEAVRVQTETDEQGRLKFVEVPGSDFAIEADIVLLAMGFTGPVQEGMLNDLGVEYNERGAVKIDDNRMTSIPGVFSAGDMSRGASLVVWCIADGRETAKAIDDYLMKDD